jgi:predicted SAM-dependent methyltransferase
MEVLQDFGKADLIILNHILEHFKYPAQELIKIKSLLNEKGILYIALPGIFSIKQSYGNFLSFLQNAHTYHYCLLTLDYILSLAGFKRLYGREVIKAVYRYEPNLKPIHPRPKIYKRIIRYLDCLEKKV